MNNIHKFREHYNDPPIIVLTNNYRSVPHVLTHLRQVITQGTDRLETTIADLTKELTASQPHEGSVSLYEYIDSTTERAALAANIQRDIKAGTKPEDIAVLARRHNELVALCCHIYSQRTFAINYERRDNVLQNEAVAQYPCSEIAAALHEQRLDDANAMLPELVAHPAFGFNAEDIWQLSLAAYRNHQLWPEAMLANNVFQPLINWLLALTRQCARAARNVARYHHRHA